MEATTYVTVPQETFNRIIDDLTEIKKSISIKEHTPNKEWLTRKEFMEACGIRTTKLYQLINSGKLETRKVGRRMYINRNSVDRYFAGK